jgi:hypothetical protein
MVIQGFLLSKHALQRMQQRGIKPWMIDVALVYGEEMHDRKGCIRYILTDRVLENTPYRKHNGCLRGLCVIVSTDEGEIVTAKWLYKLRRKTPRRFPMRHTVKNFCWS